MKKRFFSHILSILFLFAFSFEVITGLTIHPDFESSGTFWSAKNNAQHFFDFLSEELNESEEEIKEVRQSFVDQSGSFRPDRILFFDLTRLVGQYHAELSSSLQPVAMYRFIHNWLI